MGSIRFIQDRWVREAFKPGEAANLLKYLHSTVSNGVRWYVILWRGATDQPWQKAVLSAREVRTVYGLF